ncbi:MAG: site-2 protease family protein [Candidatus Firestonebacteria bacterium]
MESLVRGVIRIMVILLALTIHEFAHGFVAFLKGDHTAKDAGRLTLNPISHLDVLGALMLMFGPFGWAKPVPINPYNFKNPRADIFFVAIAGPASNLFLAFICGIMVRMINPYILKESILMIFAYLLIINCGLGIFNLLPLPPLDGSRVLASLLPAKYAFKFEAINPIVSIVGLLCIIFTPLSSIILFPPIDFFLRIFSGRGLEFWWIYLQH